MTVPDIKMNDGRSIPQIGLGTWPMKDMELGSVIPQAIEIGYRHFDTALNYGNEVGVGEGIRSSGIAREEVFVTTKLPGRHHGSSSAKDSLKESLQNLKTDYVDLYLIHWPNPIENKYVDAWQGLIDLRKEGLTRSIGVSNFTVSHLQRLQKETGVLPAVNQIQLYPAVVREDSQEFHKQNGIVTESWSPLGLGANVAYYQGEKSFLDTPLFAELAENYGKTPGQIVLRWHVQQGLVPIPKSSNPQRLADNLDVFSFELSDEDMRKISALDGTAGEIANSDEHQEF